MKIKQLTEDEKNSFASCIDNEGLYYTIFEGGWIKPEDVLEDEKDIKKVKKAINIVQEYADLIPKY